MMLSRFPGQGQKLCLTTSTSPIFNLLGRSQ
jgi:hypothetical protein